MWQIAEAPAMLRRHVSPGGYRAGLSPGMPGRIATPSPTSRDHNPAGPRPS
ncbi:MAG: hypothetical protein J0I14_08235 [Propionibacteriaceae bacterium]|jgi:hypothetical protein|nr:hypothetical protein [Propionibacteriaceae bacterium]